jgi:hypothetical protein
MAREAGSAAALLGLSPVFGAMRKATRDLKFLLLDDQTAPTGVRVEPKLILTLGVSGSPEHIDSVGMRADSLCFNKDPEAPRMKPNDPRSSPRAPDHRRPFRNPPGTRQSVEKPSLTTARVSLSAAGTSPFADMTRYAHTIFRQGPVLYIP